MYISKKMPGFFLWCAVALAGVLLGLVTVASPVVGALVCLSLVAMTLLLKPDYLLYVFAASAIPSSTVILFFGPMSFDIAATVAMFLIFSWCIARGGNTKPHIKGILGGCEFQICVFTFWATLTVLWSSDRMSGTNIIIRLLVVQIAMCVLAVLLASDEKTRNRVFLIVIATGLINALLTLAYPYFTFYILDYLEFAGTIGAKVIFWNKHRIGSEGRAHGLNSPHEVAATMSLPISLIMMLFLTTVSKKKRLFMGLLTIVMFAAMLATLSKGGNIALFVGVAYVMVHVKPLKRMFFSVWFRIGILALVLFCLTRVGNIATSWREILIDIGVVAAPSERLTSVGHRFQSWIIGLQQIRDTYGLGCGAGGFIGHTPWKTLDGAHPGVLFDLGILGLALWVWLHLSTYVLFVRTLRACRNEYYRRMLIVYLGGYVAILVAWLVTWSYWHFFLWFYLGIGFALSYAARKDGEIFLGQLPYYEKGESIVAI